MLARETFMIIHSPISDAYCTEPKECFLLLMLPQFVGQSEAESYLSPLTAVFPLYSVVLWVSHFPLSVGWLNCWHLSSTQGLIIINAKSASININDQVQSKVKRYNQEFGAQTSRFDISECTVMMSFEKLKFSLHLQPWPRILKGVFPMRAPSS